MGKSEEIPNIEIFPLTRRIPQPVDREILGEVPDVAVHPKERSLTPVKKMDIEFWHQGEEASEVVPKSYSKRTDHSKRADHLGIMLAFFALIVLGLTCLGLYVNNRRYSNKLRQEVTQNTRSAEIDFYQGNHAFSSKVAEEKASIEGNLKTEVLNVPGANSDLEISLQEQMDSMREKLEKMRTQKLLEEPPIPQPDKVRAPEPVLGVRPTELRRFEAPLEFNRMLPKQLQNEQ